VDHVAHTGEMKSAFTVLVERREGTRPLGRSRRGWENNIKMDLKEMGWYGAEWMHLALDRDQWRTLVNTVMNLRVP